MSRKIVITSGKGGAGKTTVTACLGYKLSLMGKKTVLLDLDFGLNNLDILLGVENKTTYGIEDVISGRCRAKQALVEVGRNLAVMPSSKNPEVKVSAQNVKLLMDGLKNSFDFVLVDCPAGIGAGFERAVAAADEALVVVNPSLSSLRDADKAVSLIKSYGLEKIQVVVNRARGDLIAASLTIGVGDIKKILKLDIAGVLPDDDGILLGDAKRLSKLYTSDKAYSYLAKNLTGAGKGKLYDPVSPYRGIFGRLKIAAAKRL